LLPDDRAGYLRSLVPGYREKGSLSMMSIRATAAALSIVLLASVLGAADSPAPPKAAADPAPGIGRKDLNVLLLVYDPVLKTKENLRLHEFKRWSDPWKLTLQVIEDLRFASHGYVNYRVVDIIDHDGYPTKRDGFTYDEEGFLAVLEDPGKARDGMTSFERMFEQFDLPGRIAAKKIDEIWLWGSPWFHWDELHWKIPGDRIPYQTDNPWLYRPYDIPDVGKTIWIMGFSYERGEGEALEDFCHRIESALSLTVGKGIWDHEKNGDNPWVRFTRTDKGFPGESEVGSCHAAPNSTGDYDWDNKTPVWTYADDWLTYPVLPRKKKLLDCDSGGWKGIVGHHIWFMRHLPHGPGITGGFHDNWWRYVVDYDEAIRTLPPPGADFKKAGAAMYAE